MSDTPNYSRADVGKMTQAEYRAQRKAIADNANANAAATEKARKANVLKQRDEADIRRAIRMDEERKQR